jgi:hypothetical protein
LTTKPSGTWCILVFVTIISIGCRRETNKTDLKGILFHQKESARAKALKIKSETAWGFEYTSGKLRRYKSRYVEYNRNGNAMVQYDYDRSGGGFMKTVFWYDTSANPTKAQIFVTIGSENTLEFFGTIAYKYFDDGNISQEVTYGKTGLPIQRRKFEYDGFGNRVKITLEFLDGSERSPGRFGEAFVFRYDSSGRKKEATHHYPDSMVKETFDYLESGNLAKKVEHREYNPPGRDDVTEYSYEYYK